MRRNPNRALFGGLILLATLSALTFTLVQAAEDGAAAAPAEKARQLDGKDLFKTSCKVCHGPKAAAGTYTPMSLISDQWVDFFDGTYAETHAKVAAPDTTAGKTVTESIDKDALEAIRKFCVDHAADSEQPMTCG